MKFNASFVFIVFILIGHSAFGGGFQVNLQGIRQTGMAHCGTAFTHGPSTMFFNPGAFAFMDSAQIEIGANLIFPHVRYLEPAPGTYYTETKNHIGTPFSIYAGLRGKKEWKWNAGIAMYTPFGSRIAYEDDWKGRFVIQEMGLTTIFMQVTAGFMLTDKLGFGAAYVYGTGTFDMKRSLPVQGLDGTYGQAFLEGGGYGNGLNTGLFYKFSDKLQAGLSYRSGMAINADSGKAVFTGIPGAIDTLFPNTNFSASIKLPEVMNAGISYRLSDAVQVEIDLNYVRWSVFDSLVFDFHNNTETLEDLHATKQWRDVFIYRVGCTWMLNDRMTLRGGAYFDSTPVPSDYLSPETPDADKLGLTAGCSWRISPRFGIDAYYLFIDAMKRTAINTETNFGGTWKETAHIAGFGFHYIP